MTQTANTSNNEQDQIAVATAHVALVAGALQARGVSTEVLEESKELGLTLLALPDHAEVVQAAGRDDDEALSTLMALLYDEFEGRYGGWAPTMGRNREVLPVTGAHTIEGGGAGVPSVAKPDLRARDADPGYGVRVGVADTALYAHPWLTGAYQTAPSSMWTDEGASPEYSAGHATFIAGLILQRAPGATLATRRVLGTNATARSWDVAKELVRFANSGVDVLNLSFGCFTGDNKAPLVLTTALNRLDPRVVVVAAAGNHGATEFGRRPMWPAALERVVAVATMGGDGSVPNWSPDPTLPWIDVAAEGDGVTSTYLTGNVDLSTPQQAGEGTFDGFAEWSGTSFSAAQVSGAIAAAVVPGEIGAATALAHLLAEAPRPSGSSVPWIG